MSTIWTRELIDQISPRPVDRYEYYLAEQVISCDIIHEKISVISIPLYLVTWSDPAHLRGIFDQIDHNGLTDHIILAINLQEQFCIKKQLPWIMHSWHILSKLKQSGKIINFTILTNCAFTTHEKEVDEVIHNLPDVMPVQWFLCTYSLIYPKPKQRVKNSKVLFMPGKLYRREHRITALVEILTNNTYKNNCLYGYSADQTFGNNEFDNSDQYYDRVYENLELFSPGKISTPLMLKQLLEENEHDLDGAQGIFKEIEAIGVLPVPEDVYDNVSVEYVSETSFPGGYKHVTEKTWRPMLLGYPFLHTNSLQTIHLQELGFKTFEQIADSHWHRRGWRNFDYIAHHSNDIHAYNVHSSVTDVFNLAKTIAEDKHNHNYLIDEIIDHNLNHCASIVSEYKLQLNQRHSNLFDDDTIRKLYSVYGLF